MSNKLIELRNVSKSFRIGNFFTGVNLLAVDNVSLSLDGDTPSILSIVGESGSGKTTLARILLKLHDPSHGRILLEGRDQANRKTAMSDHEFKRFVQPIFQNPFESFSARKPVDTYLFETALNLGMANTRQGARDIVAAELESVGLNIDNVVGKYRNQFSGGELQRISVARALIPRPKLIVADEPVSMIDASLRMNVVNLFLELKRTHNVSFIYITHDLSTAYYVSNYIAIMYRGNVVEYGPASKILERPEHPYTELLMASVPLIGEKWDEEVALPDMESSEYGLQACKFAPRCAYAQPICRQSRPAMVTIPPDRQSLCYRPVDFRAGITVAEDQTTVVA